MATVEEWRQYFEMIDGREPNAEDLQQAISNGDVQADTLQSITSADAPVERSEPEELEQPVPSQSTVPVNQVTPDMPQDFLDAVDQLPPEATPQPIQQPPHASQPQPSAMPNGTATPVVSKKKRNTLITVIVIMIATFIILVGICATVESSNKSEALAACQTSSQEAQGNLQALNDDLNAIDHVYDSDFLSRLLTTQQQVNDYDGALNFIKNNSVASCDSDDIDELGNNTAYNNQLVSTSNDWIQTLRSDFPKAF